MKKLAVFFLSLMVAISQTNGSEEGAVELNSDTFGPFMEKGSTFTLFYAPWCPRCQGFKPRWQQFASEYTGNVSFGMVNCAPLSAICQTYQISGFPGLIYRSENKIYRFQGNRKPENLIKFLEGGYLEVKAEAIPTIYISETGEELDQIDDSDPGDSTPAIIITAVGLAAIIVLILVCVFCFPDPNKDYMDSLRAKKANKGVEMTGKKDEKAKKNE